MLFSPLKIQGTDVCVQWEPGKEIGKFKPYLATELMFFIEHVHINISERA